MQGTYSTHLGSFQLLVFGIKRFLVPPQVPEQPSNAAVTASLFENHCNLHAKWVHVKSHNGTNNGWRLYFDICHSEVLYSRERPRETIDYWVQSQSHELLKKKVDKKSRVDDSSAGAALWNRRYTYLSLLPTSTYQQPQKARRLSVHTHRFYPRCKSSSCWVRRGTISGRGGPPLLPSGEPLSDPWITQQASWSP